MERIGKYEVLDLLGQGGMGVVYRAKDPIIGREVAIKVILDRALNAPAVRERFYREARSAGSLAHENIVSIFDVGENDGQPYLVMELLDGTDLRHLIDGLDTVPLDEALDYGIQTCRGLHHAHSKGVVHRDVKPENVRITARKRVKIMDFGIARINSETHTMTQTQIGTPRYMSPEQIRGDEIDQRTDIFSFGVMFYELLTGTNPFLGEHVTTVIYKVLHEEPPPLVLDNSQISRELQGILSGCLAKTPQKRYSSLQEVAADLQRASERLRSGDQASKGRTSIFDRFRWGGTDDTVSVPPERRPGPAAPAPPREGTNNPFAPYQTRPEAPVPAPIPAPVPEFDHTVELPASVDHAPEPAVEAVQPEEEALSDATVFLSPEAVSEAASPMAPPIDDEEETLDIEVEPSGDEPAAHAFSEMPEVEAEPDVAAPADETDPPEEIVETPPTADDADADADDASTVFLSPSVLDAAVQPEETQELPAKVVPATPKPVAAAPRSAPTPPARPRKDRAKTPAPAPATTPARPRTRGSAPSRPVAPPPAVDRRPSPPVEADAPGRRWTDPKILLPAVALVLVLSVGGIYLGLSAIGGEVDPEPIVEVVPSDTASPLLADSARQAVAIMAVQRDSAEAAGASAIPAFQEAIAQARTADAALQRGDAEGFTEAIETAQHAASLFDQARAEATSSTAELRENAEQAQQRARTAQRRVQDRRTTPAIATQYRRAEAALTAGTRSLGAGDFAEAGRLFANAERDFRAVRSTLDQIARDNTPTTPDPPSDPPSNPDPPPGDMPTPAAQVTGITRTLANRLAGHIQSKNLSGIRGLDASLGTTWSRFFEFYDINSASASTSNINIDGTRATATVNIRVQYTPKGGGDAQSNNFGYTWTLSQNGSEWRVVSVQ